MLKQAAILLCLSLHVIYAEKGYLTINDAQVPMTETKSSNDDHSTIGHYQYYEGERVRIACPKGSDLPDSSELVFVNGDETHKCFKPSFEADDISTRNFYVKLTADSNGAYAECTVKSPFENFRSRVYFMLQDLSAEESLYFRVNGVIVSPAPRQEAEVTHYSLEYGYDSAEQVEISSFRDSKKYGPLACVLNENNTPSELNGLQTVLRNGNVYFVATLQNQHLSLDCTVAVKSAYARDNTVITISLALKPFNDYFVVKDMLIEGLSTKDIMFYENCGGSNLNDHKIIFEYEEMKNVSMNFFLKGHENRGLSSEFPFTGTVSAFPEANSAAVSTTLVDTKTAGRATATATSTATTTRTATATATSTARALTTARLAFDQGKARLTFNALW